eukprot:scaffold441_cov382-Prasinococcus_capsulatus_cf.AAC.5
MERIDVSLRLRPQLARDAEDASLGSLGLGAHVVQDEEGKNILQLKKASPSTPRRLSVSQSRGGGRPTPRDGCDTYDMSASGINVFGDTVETAEVYKATCARLVHSLMNGINGTCLAYGQTGSGKTYTMAGITTLAIDDVFAHIAATPEREYLLRLKILEIYNEQVLDLLAEAPHACRLLEDPEDGPLGVLVEGAVDVAIQSAEHLKSLIEKAYEMRHVGKTSQNDCSSRSHLIIRVVVDSKPVRLCPPLAEESALSTSQAAEDTANENMLSSLNLVDLAGSERLSQSHSQGQQMKETVKINQSLLCLGNVIHCLSDGTSYIPYRNSALTRLLRHSLGGNARTAIICTLSPSASSVEQSRKTIHFAGRAREVKNQAVVNTVGGDQLIRKYRMQIEVLKKQLHEYQRNEDPKDKGPDMPGPVDASRVAKLEAQLKQTEQQYKQANERFERYVQFILSSRNGLVSGKNDELRRSASFTISNGDTIFTGASNRNIKSPVDEDRLPQASGGSPSTPQGMDAKSSKSRRYSWGASALDYANIKGNRRLATPMTESQEGGFLLMAVKESAQKSRQERLILQSKLDEIEQEVTASKLAAMEAEDDAKSLRAQLDEVLLNNDSRPLRESTAKLELIMNEASAAAAAQTAREANELMEEYKTQSAQIEADLRTRLGDVEQEKNQALCRVADLEEQLRAREEELHITAVAAQESKSGEAVVQDLTMKHEEELRSLQADLDFKEASLTARVHQIKILENELLEACKPASVNGADGCQQDGQHEMLQEIRFSHENLAKCLATISKSVSLHALPEEVDDSLAIDEAQVLQPLSENQVAPNVNLSGSDLESDFGLKEMARVGSSGENVIPPASGKITHGDRANQDECWNEILESARVGRSELARAMDLLNVFERTHAHLWEGGEAAGEHNPAEPASTLALSNAVADISTPPRSPTSTATHEELIARQKLLATPAGRTYRQPHADVLHKVVSLWSELSVPLQHRSRFYGGINGGLRNSKKYCLLELTRLNWLRAQQASKSEVGVHPGRLHRPLCAIGTLKTN